MSTSDFSSKESSVFEKTLDCNASEVSKSPDNEIINIYQLEKCIQWVTANKYKRVCLQFPDALLVDSTNIALHLQKAVGQVFFILGDTSYGSCCVDEVAAEHVNADGIIHFGHACLSPVMKLPVLYIFAKEELDLKNLEENIEKNFSTYHSLIVFYDVIYNHISQEIVDCFKKRNISIARLVVNNSDIDPAHGKKKLFGRSFTYNDGIKYNAIYLGPDSVTLMNLSLALPNWNWFYYYKDQLNEFLPNRSRFMMRRSHLVEKIKEAKAIGILIGTLGIKNYLDAVERVKILAKKNGKKSYILAVGKPNVAKLANFPEIDAFVFVACLENLLTRDCKDYYKPIVTLFEVELALGNRTWSEEYISDFRELLPGGAYHKEIAENETQNTMMEIAERNPGTVLEYVGPQYLSSRTWKGLEQNLDDKNVEKATLGQSGIPLGYEKEKETLKQH